MNPTPEDNPDAFTLPPPNTEAERSITMWIGFGSFVAVVLVFLPSQILQFLNLPLGLFATSLFVFGAAGLILPLAFNFRPGVFTGISSFPLKSVGLGMVLGAVNLPLANVLMGLAQAVLPKSWSDMADETTHLLAGAHGLTRALLILAAAGAAPIGEELFFRGWLQGVFRRVWRELPATVLVAALFSAIHFDPVGFVARVELGLLFGLLRNATGSLWPGIVMHATHNGISTAVLYLAPEEALKGAAEPFEWKGAVIGAVLSLIATRFVWRHVPRIAEEENSELLRWTPRRATPWLALNTLVIGLVGALLGVFRHSLPGANLTGIQPSASTPVAPAPAPNPQDGSRHLK